MKAVQLGSPVARHRAVESRREGALCVRAEVGLRMAAAGGGYHVNRVVPGGVPCKQLRTAATLPSAGSSWGRSNSSERGGQNVRSMASVVAAPWLHVQRYIL